MPDLGTVIIRPEGVRVLLPLRAGLIVSTHWACPRDEMLCTQLRALESGTVIDHRALLERGEVVIVRYPETKVTDAWLERLVDAAELLEGRGE